MAKNRVELNMWQSKLVNSDRRFVCLLNEFGSGKSFAASWKAHLLSDNIPNNNGVIIRNLHEDIRRNTAPLYCQYALQCDIDLLPSSINYNKSTKAMKYGNNSTINFIALDRAEDVKKIKNDVFGWGWLEQAEELTDEVFPAVVRRTRLNKNKKLNKVFLTANAEEGSWIYDTFFRDELNVIHEIINTPYGDKKISHGIWRGIDDDFLGIMAPPGANAMNLPDDYYADIIKTSPQDVVMRYVYNIPTGKGGLVYPFTDANIIEEDEYDMYLNRISDIDMLFEGQDYGISETNPMVWLFGHRSASTADIIITDEYYEFEKGISAASDYVKSVRATQGYQPHFTVGCPRTFQTEGTSERKPANLFNEYGIGITQFPILFDVRQPLVEMEIQSGRLKIFRRCENLIKELKTRKWKDIAKKTAKDHATEALERAVSKLIATGRGSSIDAANINTTMDSKQRKVQRTMTAGMLNESF